MRKLIFLSVFLFAFNLTAFCQVNSSVSTDIVTKLKSFYSGQIIEKAYLQLDRPHYAAGDTVYFKGYVTFGEQHELSGQSRVLYVDFVAPDNVIASSIKLQLNNGLARGDIALPVSLPSGLYRIRAYTRLMMDAGVTDFFEQIIPVISAEPDNTPIAGKLAQSTGGPDIRFFPEGGSLVAGVNSKIAFKALRADGLGIDVKGAVVDNTGKTVTTFNSGRLGMGYFSLQPEEGKTYKANLVFANGVQSTADVPAPDAKGITLALNNDAPDLLTLSVSCNKAYFDENQNKEFSVVMNSGVAVSRGRIKLSNPSLAVDLKKSQFRTGIVQFTLFSPEGEPLCERLVFINRHDMLNLDVNAGSTPFKPRGKMLFTITSKNKVDSLVPGHFSVSVINEARIHADENQQNNILSWILLSSDLKGYIEQPGYYFANNSPETSASLDVLMLTQGYRRFVWKQLLDGKYRPLTAKPENSLEIKGLVTSADGRPIVNDKINLAPLDGGAMQQQTTDSLGAFSFTGFEFADKARFMLKGGNQKNKNGEKISYTKYVPQQVATDRFWVPDQSELDSLTGNLPGNKKADTIKTALSTEHTLKTALSTAAKQYESVQNEATTENADQILSNKDLGDGELIDKLAAMLRGVLFLNGNFYLSPVQSNLYQGAAPGYMLIVIDGVKNASLSGLQTTDVERVELLKDNSASAYGADGMHGVLVITTKHGKDAIESSQSGVLQITVPGFYKAREFYSPKYDNTNLFKQQDLRSTIFWMPDLETGKDGNATFGYYNADGAGTYKLVIEGIDDKGNIGRRVYEYKVE